MAEETRNLSALASAYLEHAGVYYRRTDGSQTGEARNMAHALRPLVERHGSDPVDSLAAADFRRLRDAISVRLSRRTVNARMLRVRRFLRWLAARDLADPAVLARAASVEPLLAGRSTARELPAVQPVERWQLAPVVRRLPTRLAAGVLLQLWSGMRVGELLGIRWEMIDRSRTTWVYSPAHHKTAHHGHARLIALGPRCRRLLGHLPESGWLIRSRHGTAYTRRSYRLAIIRACDAARIERWTPGRLRHSAATRFRRAAGIESARVLLGHRSPATTEIYAQHDAQAAMAFAELLS